MTICTGVALAAAVATGAADSGSWLGASARGSAATVKSSLTAMGWVIVVATIFNASVSQSSLPRVISAK
jgi:hypothetical protein